MDLTNYTQIQHFDTNTVGRDLIVGDLHGCFDQFMSALMYLKFDHTVDRVFSVGDLVDRGPKSVDCALLLHQDWFYAVRGNHEQMCVDTVLGGHDEHLWVMNGGRWAYQELNAEERKSIAKQFSKLPYIITVGEGAKRFNICHAEMTFAPDITDEMIDAHVVREDMHSSWGEPLIWGRDIIQGHPAPHTNKMSLTYVGHTPLDQEPMIVGRQLYLDGGAVFGKKMYIASHSEKVVHVFSGNLHTTIDYDMLLVQESGLVD